ncbi:MAG: DUF2029 domain-containing protein [Chloroflexi bacterium]|nr:DUF2029 domain-containing protein [Chloroflexota bacterium]MBI3168990.1 DUF2029 domain-containing protein [Chloroflexota bacterium]
MNIRKRPYLIAGVLLFSLALFLRYQTLEFRNGDLLLIRTWYDFLLQNGYKGLANSEFSNYPPAYLYLLYFATLTAKWLDPFIALKLIPTAFDFISVFAVYKIARTKYEDDKPYSFAALFFLLPTVMLNSSSWGQIDSLYGSFLLVCLYLLLKERPFWAMVAFGVGFSFKAQSIFILPFLGIMFLRKRIRWYDFFVVPIVYLILALPAVWIGRDWESILFLYVGQAGQFEELARYVPNLYILLMGAPLHPAFEIGMSIFFIAMLAWAWVNWKAKPPVTQRQLILTALASAALVPFLLPKMLDRYFYPADLFSFVTAIFIPELWFFAFLFQISSGMVYMIFPFGAPPLLALPAALINTVLVVFILRHQLKSLKEP